MRRATKALTISAILLSSTICADDRLADQVERVEVRGGGTTSLLSALAQGTSQCPGGDGVKCPPTLPTPAQAVRETLSCRGGSLVLGWHEQRSVPTADAFVEQLQGLARSKAIFDCTGSACLTILPTYTRPEKANVQTLSACEVSLIAGVVGPPERCQPLVRKEGSTNLVRIVARIGSIACMMGMKDIDAIFASPPQDSSSVAVLVRDILASKPFGLTVLQEERAVLGTRAFLPSELFPDWREWVTVRVDIRQPMKDLGVPVSITTTILVSRQNTTDRGSWTAPSEQQESVYIGALRGRFVERGAVLFANQPRPASPAK